MKNFYLRILYPTSNKIRVEQFYDEIIKAQEVNTSQTGIMRFSDTFGNTVAVYPSNYTIIRMIEELE